jgi:NitT/TauT family transport system permease protein
MAAKTQRASIVPGRIPRAIDRRRRHDRHPGAPAGECRPAAGRDRMASASSGSGAGAAPMRAAHWLWLRRYAALSFVAAFGLWEAAVRLLNVAPYLLPPPSTVITELAARWPRVLDGALITTEEILAGYLLAIAISIPLALLIAYSRTFEGTLYPLIVFLQIVPKIAIAPLFIIWFGFGFVSKLLLVFLLSFFPIVVSSIAGFKSLDPEVMDLARSTGASEWLMFRKIRLPQALPSIFTGLKVGAALAATAAVVAEFVASNRGLGYLLLEYNGNLETAMVFAVVLVLSAIGLLVYYAVELLERLAIPWHVSQRAGTEMSVL